ncbi:hypothetical protein [Streptomyces sp. URMC 123]|uniref:hypothetical protein n=1 Tax=Streptomyces sp. URMC 123 TaxID=3423403 RepID=UPI003F1CA5B7
MDHGDDFQTWLDGDYAGQPVQRSEDEWALIAGHLRHAANKIGPPLPLCLPGEPQECGRTAQQHVLVWGAAVKAAAQRLIEEAAPTPANAAFAAGPLYQRHLAELRATQSTAPANG